MTDPSPAHLRLARHYLEVHRPERALSELERASANALQNPEFFDLRARALLELERHAEARDAARGGLALDPDDVGLLVVLCDAERELGNLAEAERAILAALELAPDVPALLCAYAHLCARANQTRKAERLLARAERIDPDALEVVRTHVWLAYLRGDWKAVRRETDRLLALDPENPLGHLMLGQDALERGSTRRALRHFEEVARSDPEDDDFALAAREMRVENHWLLAPLWPLRRFGPAKLWLAWIGTIGIAAALDQSWIIVIAALIYLPLVVYSWVAQPLLRWWLRRRYL